ncbi:hypothetical protein ABZ345_05615 [Lentzea sp. NPDC005914]|uniref:hypothetical protein n=1 Tax=Lentzea sp. NPDC005914 TaxID=3154572 RepID=UPI0034040445
MIDDADLARFRTRIADATQHGMRSFAALRERTSTLAAQGRDAEERAERLRAQQRPAEPAPRPAGRRPEDDDGYEVRLEDSW